MKNLFLNCFCRLTFKLKTDLPFFTAHNHIIAIITLIYFKWEEHTQC